MQCFGVYVMFGGLCRARVLMKYSDVDILLSVVAIFQCLCNFQVLMQCSGVDAMLGC